uniref:Uncharacterized protein n=1 Tax=Chromera velia CCMP2878 TaxID=1169474 RepID=A0A0G4F2I3_9ALVE|eukprot:Cvel_14787.t1-p1 / transcript=Cvel_14787.t1 / gene=Cvel_14787 / organism=Chromera_velia_CCMP2878 / gene_product=Ankyrin repeat domain-containing protein 50, putative / transcript_product=Ankyrin repeat domain-containing protein 50, putative / location=Cvel_scaffold1065:24111-24986(-) / protein_length=292 / sequence_SO=supercontig / SO=protein_coding / is_pseudo=false
MLIRNAASLTAVQEELEAVALSLLEITGMVRHMGRILGTYNVLLVSNGEGDESASHSDSGPRLPPHLPAAAAATGSPPMVPAQESAALAELRQQVETMRKGAKVHLNRIMNARCCMDLSPLFVCDIGNVIRSFAPVGADQLHETLDEFFEAENWEEGEERRAKREDLALFLHVGVDVDRLVDSQTALIKAVLATSFEAVKILVKAGAGVGMRNYSAGNSVLYIGGITFEIAEFLVSGGADVNIENSDGRQPPSLAAEDNLTDLIELYLQNGAAINAADKEGDTALHVAAMTS